MGAGGGREAGMIGGQAGREVRVTVAVVDTAGGGVSVPWSSSATLDGRALRKAAQVIAGAAHQLGGAAAGLDDLADALLKVSTMPTASQGVSSAGGDVGECGWVDVMSGSLPLGAVAAQLGCSVSTVRRRVEAGDLASFKVGRARRVPVESVAAFVAEEIAAAGRGKAR